MKKYWPHIVGVLALILSYIQPGLLNFVQYEAKQNPHATLFGVLALILGAYHMTAPGDQINLGKFSGIGKQAAFILFVILFWPALLGAQTKVPTTKPAKTKQVHTIVIQHSTSAGQTVLDVSGVEQGIDDLGVALQGVADGLDMFVAAPLEAMPKPIHYIGVGVHKIYLGLDKAGQFLAR